MDRLYVCITDADRPDNDAMVARAACVLLIRSSGEVDLFKGGGELRALDVSVPARDWAYTVPLRP